YGQRPCDHAEPVRSQGRRRERPAADQGCGPGSQGRRRDRQERREGWCARMSAVSTQKETNLTLPVKEAGGKTNGTVELPAEIFDVTANIALMHQVVTAQLAAARQGTHATKTRGQAAGAVRKPYRRKGTGRARQGSTRAPQFSGGGTVHGPQPRDYSQRTPKKMIRAALYGALSDRARNDRIHVISE